MNFAMIGYGRIAKRHFHAIEQISGKLIRVHDPALRGSAKLDELFFDGIDWVIICSPTYCHHNHVKMALSYGKKVICEKPYVLPWETVVDSDRVHVVLQTRWLDLPKTAKLVRIKAARNDAYFDSWKGDPMLTGGLFYDLFIHYVDMAQRYKCEAQLELVKEGKQERWIDDFDMMKVDMDEAYVKMYHDVIFRGKLIKPDYVAKLHWLLGRYTERYGFGRELIGKQIRMKPDGLI